MVNSHKERAAAAAEDDVAAVAATRTAACFSLCLLANDKKELRADVAAAAAWSTRETGWKDGED